MGADGDLSGLNRENFEPVLLWRGTLPLDAQGRALRDTTRDHVGALVNAAARHSWFPCSPGSPRPS